MLIRIKYHEIQHFSCSDKSRMLYFLFVNAKMPTIVGILTFTSRKNIILGLSEPEKNFLTSGPGCIN